MKRKSILLMVLILLLAIGGAIFLKSIDFFPRDNFEKALRKTIHESAGKEFAIKNVTPFTWDHLYILPPYSDARLIKGAKIKVTNNINLDGIQLDEGSCLLVFMKNSEVVYTLRFNRRYGDFSGLGNEKGYAPEEAIFFVPGNGGYWAKIKLRT